MILKSVLIIFITYLMNNVNFHLLFMFFQLKVAGPRMIPFLKTVILYFILKTYENHGEIWSTLLKCVPIYCLMIFVLLSGFKLTKEYVH
jgi:hypothetical protein